MTDYIIELNVHKGALPVDSIDTGEDLYLNGFSKNDFTDLKFTDENNVVIPHYVHSYGNYNIVRSSNLSYINFVHNGRMWGLRSDSKIYYSDDNGVNWTKANNTAYIYLLFVDSLGYIYVQKSDYKVYRSTDNGVNFTVSLNISATSSNVLPGALIEDSSGNLYAGQYQAANNIKIWKSTDHGANWSVVYSQTTQQHVHGLYLDTSQTPEAIYAGLDGSVGLTLIVKSVNEGVDWTPLTGLPKNCNFVQMASSATCRIIAGEGSVQLDSAIYRSTNDSTWTAVLDKCQTVFGLINKGGIFYACGDSHIMGYKAIWRSTDDGVTWTTIWKSNYASGGALNDFWQKLIIATPTTSIEQIICDQRSGLTNSGRIYDAVSGEHQALIYLKIPTLPVAGLSVNCKTNQATHVNTSVFTPITQADLVCYYKMNEGTGNTLNDSSSNAYHCTGGTGTYSWNNFGSRHPGELFPRRYFDSYSINTSTGKFLIPNSDTIQEFQLVKNITILLWVKLPATTGTGYDGDIFVRGSGNTKFGLIQRNNGLIRLVYGNGSAVTFATVIDRNISYYGWTMIGVSLSDDATPNFTSFIDAQSSTPEALSYAPVLNNGDKWYILNNAKPAVGSFGHLMYFDRCLTPLEVRQIYEARTCQATEPVISI